MLHVFHLDAGRTILFDIRYGVETVAKLKEAINGVLSAPAADQILLISGGEVLDCARKVASYGAGHDSSNPIFLICKCELGQAGPSSNKYLEPFVDSQTSRDNEAALIRQQNAAAAGSVSYQTIQCNAQLAKKFVKAADEYAAYCGRLVDEQHLMHQGWRAVTANLDDTARAFYRRSARFGERRDKLNLQRAKIRDLLDNFGADLALLKRIPLLSCLLDSSPDKTTANLGANSRRKSWSDISLYDWIASKEPDSSLQSLANEVKRTFDEIFDQKLTDNLAKLERTANERTNDVKMKEIKGLGQRLDQLNKGLEMLNVKQIEQKELAEKIVRKEQETLNVRDLSKISDVCSCQLEDLKILLQNNQRFSEITKRFFDAKCELLQNIRVRLHWLSDTHQIIQNADNKVLLSNERLRRIRRQLELLKQIRESPAIYALAVAEVLRRRLFGAEFAEWAKNLVEKCQNLYDDENRMRQNFSRRVDRHFLRCLFPGMDDNFPVFCLEKPKLFDSSLAHVEIQHVREIRSSVPSLAPYLQVQKAQIFQCMAVPDQRTTPAGGGGDVTDGAAGAALSRAPSFLVAAGAATTSPLKTNDAGQRRASVSLLNSLGALCQSPNWTSGDECSPSPFSALLTAARHYRSVSDDLDAAVTTAPGVDAQPSPPRISSQLTYSASPSSVPRSAPIAIPAARGGHVTTASNQCSGSSPYFSLYNAGDPGAFPATDFGFDHRSAFTEADFGHRKSSKIFSTTSLCNLTPLGEEPSEIQPPFNARCCDNLSMENELREVKKELEQSLIREQSVRAELIAAQHRANNSDAQISTIGQKYKSFLTEFKSEISSVKDNLAQFGLQTRDSTAWSSKVLIDAARKLEINLQNNLEEARKASEALQRAEFQPLLQEVRDELEKEKQNHRECAKRLENCQAYLKQKDDVIELLQQRLDENDAKYGDKLVEANSELTKRLTLEHELDLDNLRSEFRTEIEQKDAENRYLLKELNEKNRVMKQLRKEQDKLILSAYERTSRDLPISNDPSLRPLDEELLNRLKTLKVELEEKHNEKLSQLNDHLNEQHQRQLGDLKCEYELELQILRAKLKSLTEQAFQSINNDVIAHGGDDVIANLNEDVIDKHADDVIVNRLDDVVVAHDSSDTSLKVVHREMMSQSANYCTIIEQETTETTTPDYENPSCGGDIVAGSVPDALMNADGPDYVNAASSGAVDAPGPAPGSRSRFTQTKSAAQQVSVLRIHKGDLVLLTFDWKIDTFVVFTLSPILYILKESSVQRMGLQKPDDPFTGSFTAADPRKTGTVAGPANFGTGTGPDERITGSATGSANVGTGFGPDPIRFGPGSGESYPLSPTHCLLARLSDMDFCQIKKDTNRYNLPMNTKFYRVSAQRCDFTVAGDGKL